MTTTLKKLSKKEKNELTNKYTINSRIGTYIATSVCAIGIGINVVTIFLKEPSKTPMTINYDNTISNLDDLYTKKRIVELQINDFHKIPSNKALHITPTKYLLELSDYLINSEREQIVAIDTTITKAENDSSKIVKSDEYIAYSNALKIHNKSIKNINWTGIITMVLGYASIFAVKSYYADKKEKLKDCFTPVKI